MVGSILYVARAAGAALFFGSLVSRLVTRSGNTGRRLAPKSAPRPFPNAISVLVLAAVCAVLLSGCGGGKKPAGPLDDALGYFPKNAALVAVVDTDLKSSQAQTLGRLLSRLPVGDALVGQALNRLQLPGVQFDRDILPLLGHPLAIGYARPPKAGKALGIDYVLAIHVDKPIKVKQLLLRQSSLLPKGKSSGRRVFQHRFGGHFAAAVDDHTFVASGSRPALDAALATRRADDHMSERDLNDALEGLPSDAAVRVTADPRALIGGMPALRPALGVKWLSSLQRAGATLQAQDDGIGLQFKLKTDANKLRDEDLPLSSDATGPVPLIGHSGEAEIGVRDPARLARFAIAVANRLAPQRGKLAASLSDLRKQGVDLNRDLAGRLGKSGAVAIDPLNGQWAARLLVRDPAGLKASLGKLAMALPDLAAALGVPSLGVGTPGEGLNFYALARPGGKSVVFGVVGGALVAASEPSRAAALASEATHPAPDLPGSLIVLVDAKKLAARYLSRQLGGLAGLVAPLAIESLQDLTGGAAVDRNGLTGSFKLTVK
jgi:hypothetical protein